MTPPTEGSGPSVLLSFTAENARSYRDEVQLSMLATRLSADQVPRSITPAGMTRSLKVLPVAGIFGANASGKTTILRAMADMRWLVISSFRQGSRRSPVARRPFLLDEGCHDRPTRYEIDILLEGVRWIYGFEVDDERVREEYAYHWPRGRQALVFKRNTDGVAYGSPFRAADRAMGRLMRDNSLLLSVAGATANRPLAGLFDWFGSNLLLSDSDNRMARSYFTADMAGKEDLGETVVQLLQAVDLGVTGLTLEPMDDEETERILRSMSLFQEDDVGVEGRESMEDVFYKLILIHSRAQGEVSFGPDDESQGTLAWVSLIGPMLHALHGGQVILMDELDTSLHPILVEFIISMFQDPRTNPKSSQLIFNSHDGLILKGDRDWALGRDQIWFTEKQINGDTRLYPLDGFKPRRDEAIDRRYFEGRYGAIPMVIPAPIPAMAAKDE